ncbi:MAG: AAA family ATPase [Candidatus Micrarchaeota archaeon]|nr:AAA family ATPase [Candidatus Micrarchaeota archaeon]
MADTDRSLSRQKLLATAQMLRSDENIGGALLVALGTLFLLISFNFYPLFVSFFLAALSGAIAYSRPPLGTIFGMLVGFPAVSYQSPVLAWVFCAAVAITLFEAFEHWSTISFLKIAIFLPFAPPPISYISGFLMLFLAIAAFRFGSRHSLFISLPSVFIVLLLSTLWLQPTSSFVTISNDYLSLYGPGMPQLLNNEKPQVELGQLFAEASNSFWMLFDAENIRLFSEAIGLIFSNTAKLFTVDFAFLQLFAWAIALFACASLPPKIEDGSFLFFVKPQTRAKYKQTIASLSLFIIPLNNLFFAASFNNPIQPASFAYCAATVAIISAIEHFGISLSREKIVLRRQKQKAFGKFGLQDLSESDGVQSLADVGGYEDVKSELREAIIAPLKQKELAYTYGIKPPTGILFFGPPGTGKTLLMKALAKELDLPFYYVKCSDLLSEWYGESEKNVAEVFAIARKNAPCVLFFDEIDSIGKRRDAYSNDDVAPRVMSVLLSELDGFKGKKNVITIGATNVPDQLDPALMRPGRFDKIIYMPLPDFEARKAIFKVHLKKLPVAPDIDFDKLASMTERYSGADIKNICTEASREAAREAIKSDVVVPISMKHLTLMIKRIKPSVSLDMLESYNKFRMDYERRSRAEEKKPDERQVRWEDVAGLEEVRRILLESIELPLLHEDLMKEMDVKPSKGLLLFGPPGCGKTMIVKAAANELSANFLSISGSELMRGSRSPVVVVREIFNRARESAPALIFIDEIEALAPSREHYSGGILSELLQEIDGIKELKNVMIIGATNKPSALDPAILRPGRFDKIIYIPPPDLQARKQIFASNLAKFLERLDLNALAAATEGFSGADIASICQDVKMQLVRNRLKGKPSTLTTADVMEVISKRRPSITQKDLKEYIAFMHEYGERK